MPDRTLELGRIAVAVVLVFNHELRMFRSKRSDTTVATIERTYRINLNARADMLLGNLLDQRGFESQSQLLDAYFGRLTYHPRKRRIFLSFHAEDKQQVQGFR